MSPSNLVCHHLSTIMERETETPETTMDAVPPTPGGSNGHGEHSEHGVKAEEVEEALREPQNTHPRKAAGAACLLIKLANVAAHAGHKQAAACLLLLGAGWRTPSVLSGSTLSGTKGLLNMRGVRCCSTARGRK